MLSHSNTSDITGQPLHILRNLFPFTCKYLIPHYPTMGLLVTKLEAGLSVMVRFAVTHALLTASKLCFYIELDMNCFQWHPIVYQTCTNTAIH